MTWCQLRSNLCQRLPFHFVQLKLVTTLQVTVQLYKGTGQLYHLTYNLNIQCAWKLYKKIIYKRNSYRLYWYKSVIITGKVKNGSLCYDQIGLQDEGTFLVKIKRSQTTTLHQGRLPTRCFLFLYQTKLNFTYLLF